MKLSLEILETLEVLWRMCDFLCGGEDCPERKEVEEAVDKFCLEYEPYEICKTIKSIYGIYLSKVLYAGIEIPVVLQNIIRNQLWNLGFLIDTIEPAHD